MQINRTDDVHVVQQERLGSVSLVFQKKPGSLFQAATSVQQHILAGYFNPHSKTLASFQIVDHHVREVVDINDSFGHAERLQTRERNFQQRSTSDFHQS